MQTGENSPQPVLSQAEPVLAVANVQETMLYWQEVLGFPNPWAWGDPPGIGAVSWHGAHIQFVQNPGLAMASKGNSVWIRVQHLETLYALHQKNNAEIVAPLENQPWGMAQYIIRDPNGYFVIFAGHIAAKDESEATLPGEIRVIARTPTPKEYAELGASVGWWQSITEETAQARVSAALFAVVAENTLSGEVVGYALLLGDACSFYYVKDVAVHPNWQRKQVGTALMRALMDWLQMNGANNAMVALFTGEALEPFYQQFGFTQSFGMHRHLKRNEEGG